MKKIIPFVALIAMLASCSTQEELSYLNNLDAAGGEDHFTMEIPEYKIQPRDILYISAKTQTPDGTLQEIFADKNAPSGAYIQSDASQYVMGYSIDPSGYVTVPLLGRIPVEGMTIYEIRDLMQAKVDSLFPVMHISK